LVTEGVSEEVRDILARAAEECGQSLEAYLLGILKAEVRRIQDRGE